MSSYSNYDVEVTDLSVEGVGADSVAEDDWMSSLLQSPLFRQVPPMNIQLLFQKFESIDLPAGAEIVQEGQQGDYFYVVEQGRAAVFTRASKNNPGDTIEMGPGSYFGEDALIGETTRNATVVMMTGGRLRRLSKGDFRALIQEPVIQYLNHQQVGKLRMGDKPVRFVDIRLGVEFRHCHVDGALNMPLASLRDKISLLDHNAIYIVTSEGGQRSEVAAHILCKSGYTAYIAADSQQYYTQ